MRATVATLAYLTGCTLLFLWLWAYDATDDYAGWSPAIAVISLPAVLAIARAPTRPGHRHAAAVAIPAGLALACAAVGGTLRLSMLLGLNGWALLGVLALTGPVFAGACAAAVWRHLLRQPLHVGATHVLRVVAAAGLLTLLLLAPLWWDLASANSQGVAAAALLFGALPLAWTIGPALALWIGRPAPT